MFMVCLILFLTRNYLHLAVSAKGKTEDECSTNSDCSSYVGQSRQVCCTLTSPYNIRVCTPTTCVGHICYTDGDCGGFGECCINHKCTKNNCLRCSSNSECAFSEYCCFQGFYENICRRSCVGEICLIDNDCSGPGEYCETNRKCAVRSSSSSSTFPSWAIALVTVVVLFIVAILGLCLYFGRCNKTTQRVTRSAAETNENNVEESKLDTPLPPLPQPTTTSSSHYNNLIHNIQNIGPPLQAPPPYPSQGENVSQTDNDGYELFRPRQ